MAPDQLAGSATVTGLLSATDLRSGEVVGGRYRILRLLGMGGMGVVYQAHDIELDIDIALKLLRPELASRPDAFERFRQELLLARQVSSPHVVRIHDLVKHGQAWLISMDFVDGESLEHLLDKQGALPPERAIGMLRQLAQGLAAAHHRGVVHRDLKPANILVNHNGDAAITDFGVARSAGNTGITASGVIIGTPEYLSPEQARAEPLDGRSDLYALGLIFHEMLTATLPFRGGTPAEMLAQRIVRDPPPPDRVKPDLPSFAVRLCTRLLELKPARRFQSADEVVRAIDTRRVPGFDRKQRKTMSALAAGLVALTLAAGIWHWREFAAPAQDGAPIAASKELDLAPLPFTAAGNEAADIELAMGIGRSFADALASDSALRSADPLRVSRALTELGYDTVTAQRHRPRVAEALGAASLLEGEVSRTSAGISVKLSIYAADAQQPRWAASTPISTLQDLPAALKNLQGQLNAQLRTAGALSAWPDASTLQAIGTYGREVPAPAALESALQVARRANDPELWWLLLESLDHTGRTADATSTARQAVDALATDSGYAASRVRAYAFVLLGDNEQAKKILEVLLQSSPNDHPAAFLLARAYGELGDFDHSLALLGKLTSEDPRNTEAWYALGKYSIQAGDSKRAVDDYLVRAQVLANRLDDKRMQADVSNAFGIGYRRVGQMALAAEQLARAEQQREALGDKRGQAASLRNLATVRSMQGDFAAADAALAKARSIVTPLGDVVALADLANDAGLLAEERGDYRNALEEYRRALNLRQSNGDPRLIGESLINVGFSYYQIGEFDNAQIYSQQAETIYAKIDDRAGSVHARQNLGLIEVARGDWDAARKSQQASLRDAEELQMAEERTISISALAELDRLEGIIEPSLQQSTAALDDFVKRDDPRGITEMKLQRSAAFCDVGDWNAAESALDGMQVDALENGEQASLLAWRRGEIALGRGDAKAAFTGANDAIARAQKAHSYGSELSARLLRARALAAQDKPADAARELAGVREGLAGYASVPLRLQLAETALRVTPEKNLATYREARAQLARLPSYGRAFLIHAYGADALGHSGSSEAADARHAASAAYAQLLAKTPEPQHAALAALAAAAGLNTGNSP
jgi:tetratricopeptide (TPR) repeat protein